MEPGGLLKGVQFRLTPEKRRRLQYGWEFLNFGVLGLNSFVLLYLHSARSSVQAIICAGMTGYALVLLLQIFLCRGPHAPGGWSFSGAQKRCSGLFTRPST